MIQVTIRRSGIVSNQASFPTLEEAQSWLDSHTSMGSFGSPRYSKQMVEISPAVLESQEILDEEGQSFDPPQFHDVEIVAAQSEEQDVETNPDGYEISIEDTSAAEEQAALNAASLEYLKETDWMLTRMVENQTPVPKDVLDQRAAARAAIVR